MNKFYGFLRSVFRLNRFVVKAIDFDTGRNYMVFDTYKRVWVSGTISSTYEICKEYYIDNK